MAFEYEKDLNQIRELLIDNGNDRILQSFDNLISKQKELVRYVEDFHTPDEPLVDNDVGRGPRPLTDLLEMMWEFAQPNQAKVLRSAITFIHTYSTPISHNPLKKV